MLSSEPSSASSLDHIQIGEVRIDNLLPLFPPKTHFCPWEDCKKGFTRRSDLRRHIRIHKNERPYSCKECGKSFIQRSALTVHIRVHTKEKPYHCDWTGCNRSFSDSSSLARHKRTHQGLRPYACRLPGCQKRFTRRTTLVKHIQQHNAKLKNGCGDSSTIVDEDDDTLELPSPESESCESALPNIEAQEEASCSVQTPQLPTPLSASSNPSAVKQAERSFEGPKTPLTEYRGPTISTAFHVARPECYDGRAERPPMAPISPSHSFPATYPDHQGSTYGPPPALPSLIHRSPTSPQETMQSLGSFRSLPSIKQEFPEASFPRQYPTHDQRAPPPQVIEHVYPPRAPYYPPGQQPPPTQYVYYTIPAQTVGPAPQPMPTPPSQYYSGNAQTMVIQKTHGPQHIAYPPRPIAMQEAPDRIYFSPQPVPHQ